MSFASESDLDARFGESEVTKISDHEGDGERDAAAVNAALETANAEVSAAVATANLPEDKSYPLLTQIACDIAREVLYDDSPTEPVRERARKGREMLISITERKMRVADTQGNAYPDQFSSAVPIGPGLIDGDLN